MNRIRHNDLTILYPDDWEDGTQLVVVGQANEGFRPNVVLSHDAVVDGESAEQFAGRHLPMLRQALSDYILDNEEEAAFGPHRGWLREQRFTANGQELRQLQFYVLRGAVVHTLTFTHLSGRFDDVRKTAERIFEQVEFDAGLPADEFLG
jgi:hypothetical protein